MEEWQAQMVTCLAHEQAKNLRVEEALAIKYDHRPNSVFKYRKVDDWSLQNLENDCVWVCSPTDYNDPYDSSISITSEALTSTILQDGVKELIKQERLQAPLAAENPTIALQEALLGQDQVPSELWPPFIAAFEEQVQQWKQAVKELLPGSHKDSLKVCSFSGTVDSIIMWSHYADQHRGFSIEYDLQVLPPENLFVRMLYPVIYSDTLFDATRYYLAALRDRPGFNILFPALASLYKSPEWSYEREWRLVIPAGLVKEPSRWHVPKPKRLYLGSRMKAEQRDKVLAIARKRDIEVYQTFLAEDSFSLRSEPAYANS